MQTVLPTQTLAEAGESLNIERCGLHDVELTRIYIGPKAGEYFCGVCTQEEVKAEERQRVIDYQKSILKARLVSLDIGKRFWGKTFANYEAKNPGQITALKICQRYADTFADRRKDGDGMILMGKPGTGKNHLAAAVAASVINEGHTVLHTTAIKLVRAFKGTWRKESDDTEGTVVKRFLSPDLLVIDEVGSQFGSQTEQIFLMEVINGRYGDLLPTILLTNLDEPALCACLGDQVVDRFYEGKGQVIVFGWESYRRQG